MSSKGLQLFASGLLFATVIIGGMYMWIPKEEHEPTVEKMILSSDEMKKELEQEGFVVLTTEEWEQEKNEKVKEEEKIIYNMVLTIEPGMTSYDIADQLERGHILAESTPFLDYVETNQLSTSLAIGEYDVSNEQSIEEIVTLITKKR